VPVSEKPSEGERYIVVDGRRWRRSDPTIPDSFRAELVRELMSARRAVLAAKRDSDAKAETAARARVQDAKVALGERGRAYWDEPDEAAQRSRAASAIRALLSARGPAKTICPSDVARTIGGERWRTILQRVRDVASELADRGELEVRQRGAVVRARTAKGPIRLAIPKRRRSRRRE
jgi:hypothetical protein